MRVFYLLFLAGIYASKDEPRMSSVIPLLSTESRLEQQYAKQDAYQDASTAARDNSVYKAASSIESEGLDDGRILDWQRTTVEDYISSESESSNYSDSTAIEHISRTYFDYNEEEEDREIVLFETEEDRLTLQDYSEERSVSTRIVLLETPVHQLTTQDYADERSVSAHSVVRPTYRPVPSRLVIRAPRITILHKDEHIQEVLK